MDGSPRTPKVVILGAGFGGLTAARSLKNADVEITLIDRQNYHLFQPLLYQVATATLSPADIAVPVRSTLRDQKNTRVLLGEVTHVDRARRLVDLADGRHVPYDWLVVATGARHAYFGHDEWEPFAPGLKKIDDATEIRRRVLLAFEKAETEPDEEARKALLTFVIVGGGPTGVEMAGAIIELARETLVSDFHHIDPSSARVLLIEAGPRILPVFAEDLSAFAKDSLVRKGVEVMCGEPVTECGPRGVAMNGERIAARTIVWAAGVEASPAAKWLGVEGDRAGRVPVNDRLTLEGDERIFVVGDTAAATWEDGRIVPGIAPAAKQMGAYAAKAIRAALKGETAAPFRYWHQGNLATIGRKSAIVDFGRFHLKGFLAWLVWGAAHIYFLIGFRNRLIVMLHWIWAYVTMRQGVRLITGSTDLPE
ncbi:NAD(P)/FAD-dependent oxidoreductase [Parvibaculum sp.]|uniref:NAD(P)/FAD-dependent oxidoreductase n=2 Tax=Parvibaculum sp. TaxID=2024848 RepID=UPI001B0DE9CF|nr:NAD(P)/FAD-dependent oxidoreductase [Parvibaculum sp.]MBO6633682.1 NAD(P)/FAD-dependent oxidoreductase [Parvibaculum sp.]MBO6677312.1 NAD(P)/FAD-dependent oxidoreductase [Parvibaculum sp.]